MRAHRLFAALVAFLAVLVGAAFSSASPGLERDGTLTIRQGRGTFVLQMRGSVVGRIDRGRITIEDPVDDDAREPVVRGHEWFRDLSETTTVYGGTGIRFRFLGGRFTLRIANGVGTSLSAVGRGKATLRGAVLDEFGFLNGVYSLNGDEFLPIPGDPITIPIRAPLSRP